MDINVHISIKNTFKAAAVVPGARSLGGCPLVGLVPCYPVCHLPPALVNRVFHATVTPPPPIPLGTARIGCVAVPAQSRLVVMPLIHEAFCTSRTGRYHLSAFLAATVHTSASTRKTNLDCSVDPLVASTASRSSSRHLYQLFGCPPGPRPSPTVIFLSITRLGNRPTFCRATPPATKSRRLRMVVSMLSHRVFLRAFAYERVV